MKIVIEDVAVAAKVYGQLQDVELTIEIDTDRMGDAARRVINSRMGESTWAGGAIRAFLQDEGE